MNKEDLGVRYTAYICLGLSVLILVIFFSAAFGEKAPKPQKEISVVLYSAGSDGWEAMAEGMKRAEEDFSVNINYVIMREDADGKEQFATIEREIENGAEGVIVAVSEYATMYKLWIGKDFTVPIVAVESGFNESIVPTLTADNYEMGKLLGEEILKDFPDKEDLVVAIDSDAVYRDSVREREQGLRDVLEGKADIISLRVAVNGEGADAAVALHKEAVLDLAERTDAALYQTKRYGIGNTASVVAALDQGRLDKLVFQNEFNMGYLAVETIMGEIGMTLGKERDNIDFYCVSREELYDSPYEQLLFPIVE